MRVSDIAKLIDNKSEVFIYTKDVYLDCLMNRDEWDCSLADNSENGCGDCDYSVPKTSEWESYHGLGENIPIKLGEKKVTELNVRVRTLGRGRSKKDCPCLGVRVEAHNGE